MVRLSDKFAIADQLHDELLPYLFAAAASLDALRRREPELAERLKASCDLIDQSRSIAKRILNDSMTPWSLDGGPLEAAKAFINKLPPASYDSAAVASVHWSTLETPAELARNLDQQEAIFRILIEAVRNALRHAAATRIQIDAVRHANQWIVTVSDDGIGLDPGVAPTRPGSTGLKRCMARASETLGLQLTLLSEANAGTRVVLTCHI